MAILWKPRNSEETLAKDESSTESFFRDMPSAVLKLLRSRGFHHADQVSALIHAKPQNLSDPFQITDMRLACARLVEAYRKQEKVCVYADFDLDGTSGLAMAIDGLSQLGFQNLVPIQPKRMKDGYGFHPQIVEELSAQGVSLILTIDVGITAEPAVQKAKSLGIDVIISDHHQVIEKVPSALAVVNPNREDDHSGLGYLCGAGVAFYLLRALKRSLVNEGLAKEEGLHLQSLLDCFAIATLTDMVPLIGDNRVLVRLGLKQLELSLRPGLAALLESLGMDGRALSSQDVAIRFAPKLNALSRMEGELMPIDIYMAKDQTQARKMIDRVLASNADRVQFQEDGDTEATSLLESWDRESFIFLVSEKFHRGIVGLIATRLANQKRVPTFIGSVDSEGVVTGSARLPNGDAGSLVEALDAAQAFLHRFGGHEAAAGFETSLSKVKNVTESLDQYYLGLKLGPKVQVQHYDVEAELFEVDSHLMNWLDRIGPFGTGFETPLFKIQNCKLTDVFKLRGGHLRLKLQADNKKMDGVLFSPSPELLEALPVKNDRVDVIAEIQWNYFGGAKGIQLLIKDIMKSENILKEISYGQAEI